MGLVRLDSDGKGGWQPGSPKPAYFAVKDMIRGSAAAPLTFAQQSLPSKPAKPVVRFVPARRNSDLGAFKDISDVTSRHRIPYAYCLVLNRKPDGVGLRTWSHELANGRTISELLLAMLPLEEFSGRNASAATSLADFVRLTYWSLLDRAPDDEALANYSARLERSSMSRSSLLSEIIVWQPRPTHLRGVER